jgi:hypothetical protein
MCAVSCSVQFAFQSERAPRLANIVDKKDRREYYFPIMSSPEAGSG